jgi:dephospho-CoA kinase
MQKIGLTGNIGSGKTTVARIFKAFGVALFNADNGAKNILNEETQLKILVTRFGNQILNEDRQVDRKRLAEIIFNNEEALAFINHLIHPLVRKRFKEFCRSRAKERLCIYEAAVLIETGFFKQMDKVILVTAPIETRIHRVMERDKISRDLVMERMKNQWDEICKARFADFTIVNDNTLPLLEQCEEIFQKLSMRLV